MTATLKHSWGMTIEKDGTIQDFGTKYQAVKAVSIPGTLAHIRQVVLPKQPATGFNVPTRLWSWLDQSEYKHLVIQAEGVVDLAWYADLPTSSSDPTPAGTHLTPGYERLNCFAERCFTNLEQFVLPTNSVSYTGADGLGILYAAGRVLGRIYGVYATNPDTTKDVKVTAIAVY